MEDAQTMSSIWQTGMINNHIQADRYILDKDRIMYVFNVRRPTEPLKITFLVCLNPPF